MTAPEPSDTDLRDEPWMRNPCPGCACLETNLMRACCWCGETVEAHP